MKHLQNTETEAGLLGALLSNNRQVERVLDLVGAEDFADYFHSLIFTDIVAGVSAGKQVSPVTLSPLYKGVEALNPWAGDSYLAKLTSSVEVMLLDVRQAAKDIRDLAIRRRIIAGLEQAKEMAGDVRATQADIISTADAALSEAMRSTDGIEQSNAGEAFRAMLAAYDEPKSGVTCHQIPTVDALLGPIRRKELVIMAGRPGMGKTAVALSYGVGAARSGFNGMFVSLEMSADQLMQRAAADVCFDSDHPIPYNVIRDGSFESQNAKRRVWEATRLFDTLPLEIVDAGMLTVGRLNMLVQRHKRKLEALGQTLDFVIVDYLQLLHPDRRGLSRYEQVTEVSMMLKAIAKMHDVSIIALAQLSREVEKRQDKRPVLSDLRDSGQIEQDADSIIFLYREAYYLQAALPKETDPSYDTLKSALDAVKYDIEIIAAKRRSGETGSGIAQFHGHYQAVRG